MTAGLVAVHMVWTRAIDGDRAFGRLQVARATRAALQEHFDVRESILRSLAVKPTAGRLLRTAMAYLGQLLRGRVLPLQCALYADPAEIDRVIAEIGGDVRAVYIDGVRCLPLLRRARARRPDLAVVTDLDDLMSRRMALLIQLGQAPSTGYMKGHMPGFVEAILRSHMLAQAILRYECATLRPAERAAVALGDRTVLISQADAAVLTARVPGGKVEGVAPPARLVRDAAPLAAGALRFVFVGTDTLRQNELTIDALIDLWRRYAIVTPLAIYGDQQRGVALPSHVTMPGYAPTIDDVYDGRSILLSPSYLAGGLKTKVLEAFGYGAAVIGNAVTFEGIDIGAYPLLIEDEATLVALLRDPAAQRATIDAAAAHGARLVREHHDPARFVTRWAALVDAAIRDHPAQGPATA